jgi:hypothetical protein
LPAISDCAVVTRRFGAVRLVTAISRRERDGPDYGPSLSAVESKDTQPGRGPEDGKPESEVSLLARLPEPGVIGKATDRHVRAVVASRRSVAGQWARVKARVQVMEAVSACANVQEDVAACLRR